MYSSLIFKVKFTLKIITNLYLKIYIFYNKYENKNKQVYIKFY